ncbi:DUF3515 domain-containing protein [Oerskovia sp. KBS0722]|uniref:DUF3515 domain-containing protein n=1 Tax=Oerskovia sp. KBS0722 TaxID=1179673 RepID=UPI001FEE917F|nr:DUF3515 domain-containing protein [Oerskovia sp. KBS0722]
MLNAPRTPARRRTLTGILLVAVTASLGACAPTIGVPVADDAANPKCAEVVLAVPDELAGLPKIKTDSQATAAWGEPGAAVTLRCGVTPPEPTTVGCMGVPSNAGSVDWIVTDDGKDTWTFVTYGRDPAVEVQLPPAVSTTRTSSFVSDLNRAVSKVEQTSYCM